MAGRHRKPTHTKRTVTTVSLMGGLVAGGASPAAASEGPPVPEFAAVIQCESGGDPRAQNRTSTASGLYQFINSTWKLFGGSTARARDASVAEQHAVAARAFAVNGLRDWEASRRCWGPKLGRHVSDAGGARHAVSTPPSNDLYVVRRGDTLARIAAAHHVALNTIIANNRDVVDDPDLIFPGERIRV